MIEGEDRSPSFRRAIHETIQKQALINFETGLRDNIKVLVRSQRYTSLQEAINGASTEEKLNEPSTSKHSYESKKRNDSITHDNGKVRRRNVSNAGKSDTTGAIVGVANIHSLNLRSLHV